MNVLVTGGAGYIGSHTVLELLNKADNVIVYDNLSKGHAQSVADKALLIEGDIREEDFLKHVLETYEIDCVVHFAADSLVGESMLQPSKYYHNNVLGTLALLDTMHRSGVDKIVFSSTAAVYGQPDKQPITEDMLKLPTNVYGRTKLIIENMLADYYHAYGLHYVALRYFNAAGAQADGHIGEDHQPETHLIPLLLQTAMGQRDSITVFGTDYPTFDGTCIRDYIHVGDLATAHVLAVECLLAGSQPRVYNLGTETGYSVKQVIDTAKKVTGIDFAVKEGPRREGDPAVLVAASAAIQRELGWRPVMSGMENIIQTAWRWHQRHPRGFDD